MSGVVPSKAKSTSQHLTRLTIDCYTCIPVSVVVPAARESSIAKYQNITAETAASAGGKGCVYNQDVQALIKNTRGLTIEKETSYVTRLFRSFICVKHVTKVPNR
jgi:hypothetical protein